MPRDDGLLARFDPESVSESPPTRLATVPRLVLAFHLAVAAAMIAIGALAAAAGQPVRGVIIGAIGGMAAVAGWAAGRIAARR